MSTLSEIQGRKIFFLYPATVIQNRVIEELTQQELEVYIVKDHIAIKKALHKYPNSIVFADINEKMNEAEWETWIRGIMRAQPDVLIGIVTSNRDENLMRKYINSVKIHCGYTMLRSDLNKTIVQIFEALKTVNAKGRRKYIRACIERETTATINLMQGNSFINGVIRDISVVGISCTFEQDPGLTKNALFKDIQIKLQSMLLKVEAIIFGSRTDYGAKTYVMLFTQRIDPEVRTKIRKYIQHNLQSKMDLELK